MRRRCRCALLACLLVVSSAEAARAQNTPMGILDEVGFDQRLDARIPLDMEFRNASGARVTLGDYMGEKPVVLSLVYFECPMLCTLVLNGLVRAMRAIEFDAGSEYEVVSVSFDPRETPEMAAAKQEVYRRNYGATDAGWHFLTGDQEAIDRLTEAAGFRYAWDEASRQWAHASGILVLTPDGRISKYLYGIEYAPRDLRLALVDAASGRIGSPIDQLLLYCYHYDPTTGRYGLMIMNVIRLLGFVTVGGIGLFIALALARERRRARVPKEGEAP